MASKFMRVERAGQIATIWLDDADARVNTVSRDWIEEMIELFGQLGNDGGVAGIIITSAKPGFMAGADLNQMLDLSKQMSPAEAFAFSQRASHMHRLIETCGKPVVAAINGFALGGGYELALACHRRIAADVAGMTVGLPEVSVGLLPGSGGTQRLPRLIGVEAAIDALVEGQTFGPVRALELGMIDELASPGDLLERARAWIESAPEPIQPWDRKGFKLPQSDGLLKQSTAAIFTGHTGRLLARNGQNYPAPIAILTCIFEGVQVPIDAGLRIESRHFARLLTGATARNIIRTSFVNRSLAEKGARRPVGIAASRASSVAVLGAGMMGAGIAYVAARSGAQVVLLDVNEEAAGRGKAHAQRLVEKAVKAGKMGEADGQALLARIRPTADYADLAGSQLVVEAVFEDTKIKAEVTARAEAVIPPDAIFATNTSTLPISQLAEASSRPERFIGLHFFSPVDRMKLVEIIMGRKTGDEALARAIDFVAQLRKIPIVVNDSRGFYTSRVFQTFIHEGMELLAEGVNPALIENAARQAGMPVGPLAVTDEVSLELPLKIIRQSADEDPRYTRPGSAPILEKMAEGLGRKGRKGGGGFYDYEGGDKRLWPGLASTFPAAEQQPTADEVGRRLLYIQALETARCLEEGVLTSAADADIGSLFGWGFPAWAGGTLSLIDTIGVSEFVEQCDSLAQRHGSRFAPTAQLRDMARSGTGFHD